jgi:hypothetical protein
VVLSKAGWRVECGPLGWIAKSYMAVVDLPWLKRSGGVGGRGVAEVGGTSEGRWLERAEAARGGRRFSWAGRWRGAGVSDSRVWGSARMHRTVA